MSIDSKRVPALDGIRGIAILGVMAYHLPKAPSNAFERVVAGMTLPGQTGVDLFFVLSGFLITGILLDSRHAPNALRTFYIRRLLRIFPLYYGTLAVLYLVLPGLNLVPPTPVAHQLWFWSYLQNVGFTFFDAPGPNHFWSLAVEEHFYLLWPLIVFRADRRTVTGVLAAAIGISVVARAALIVCGYGTFYFTLCRLDGLALGGLLAVMVRSESGLSKAATVARRLLLFGTIPLGVAYVMFSGSQSVFLQLVKSTVIGVIYAASVTVVLAASPGSTMVSILSNRVLRSAGKYSYAMYVFHPFIFNLLRPSLGTLLVADFALATGVTYVAARASWYLWEYPFLQLRKRYEYVTTARSTADASDYQVASRTG